MATLSILLVMTLLASVVSITLYSSGYSWKPDATGKSQGHAEATADKVITKPKEPEIPNSANVTGKGGNGDQPHIGKHGSQVAEQPNDNNGKPILKDEKQQKSNNTNQTNDTNGDDQNVEHYGE